MKNICFKDDCGQYVKARGLCNRHYLRLLKEGGGKTPCSMEGCTRSTRARTLCGLHYEQARNRGEFPGPGCTFEGCEKPHAAKGLCQTHYMQRRSGTPLREIRKPGDWGAWSLTGNGYLKRKRIVDGVTETQLQHRLVMEEHIGRPLLKHENVHHKNGDRVDNRLENLEIWNTSQHPGQRPVDKVEYAVEILRLYAPHLLTTLSQH